MHNLHERVTKHLVLQFSTKSHYHARNVWPIWTFMPPGGRLNIKTVLSTYGDFHVKDKTAIPGKTVFLIETAPGTPWGSSDATQHLLWIFRWAGKVILYLCWFNLYALAQGNACKPVKEPINYRGPSGDWTRYLQTEATPTAASL